MYSPELPQGLIVLQVVAWRWRYTKTSCGNGNENRGTAEIANAPERWLNRNRQLPICYPGGYDTKRIDKGVAIWILFFRIKNTCRSCPQRTHISVQFKPSSTRKSIDTFLLIRQLFSCHIPNWGYHRQARSEYNELRAAHWSKCRRIRGSPLDKRPTTWAFLWRRLSECSSYPRTEKLNRTDCWQLFSWKHFGVTTGTRPPCVVLNQPTVGKHHIGMKTMNTRTFTCTKPQCLQHNGCRVTSEFDSLFNSVDNVPLTFRQLLAILDELVRPFEYRQIIRLLQSYIRCATVESV